MINFTGLRVSVDGYDLTNVNSLHAYIKENIDKLKDNMDFYGTDLATFGEGELLEDKNDVMTVTGILNYAQAITHRLMTPRGYHPEDETLGIPWYSYLGQVFTDVNFALSQLKVEIYEELMRDYRTASVDSITITKIDLESYSIHIELTPSFSDAGIGVNFNVSR